MKWFASKKVMFILVWALFLATILAGVNLSLTPAPPAIAWGHLITPRNGHLAFLLPDGKVFIVGGYRAKTLKEAVRDNLLSFIVPSANKYEIIVLHSGELYDPKTNLFSEQSGISIYDATLIGGNTILLFNRNRSLSLYNPELDTNKCTELSQFDSSSYEGSLGSFNQTILLRSSDISGSYFSSELEISLGSRALPLHRIPAPKPILTAKLNNGNVLAICDNSDTYTCKIYHWDSHSWSKTGSVSEECTWDDCCETLFNGRVLLIHRGGNCELFDPTTGHWSKAQSIGDDLCEGSTITLKDGRVLKTGDHCYLYEPITGKWTQTGMMHEPRWGNTTTLLLSGKVLITGGRRIVRITTVGLPTLSSCELYDPATGQWTIL